MDEDRTIAVKILNSVVMIDDEKVLQNLEICVTFEKPRVVETEANAEYQSSTERTVLLIKSKKNN